MDIFAALDLEFNPFPIATSTEGYFHTRDTDLVLKELLYGIESRKGFLLLTGEVGVGKTSLILQLLAELAKLNVQFAWVFNTMLGKEELFIALARDFGLEVADGESISSTMDKLHKFFLAHNSRGVNCAIVIDEAHNLGPDSLEALRMLSNLEEGGVKLVQILLSGQPELLIRLQRPDMRQFLSRINIF